jgi:predicted ATPase
LTVFTGGFVLAAAKEICAGEGVAAEDIPELVAALTEKSVLARETDGTATRYRVREGFRERGSQWLVESGEHAPLQRRHRFWYAGAVARVNANLGLGVAARPDH